MNHIDDELEALVARDYQFAHTRDDDGAIVTIVGVRVHHGVIDIVQLYAINDAEATRMPGDEIDIIFPQRVLWRATGSARHVIDQLLALDDPLPQRMGLAGSTGAGRWTPTVPPQTTWPAAV
ncbi:MAG: hypothetical protein J2O49_05500 [Sciscionella sp.]|nr:hypothetical protein [Sciscionella sp.]